jgi:membrane-bound lytic murein transglycosylase D
MLHFNINGWFMAAVLSLGIYVPVQAGYFDDKHYPIVTDPIFTVDAYVMDQVKFWFAIYVEVGVDEGLIHDPVYPDMVFKKIKAPTSGRIANKVVETQVNALKQEIRDLLAMDSSSWTGEQKKLMSRFPSFWDSTAIALCLDRLRFQRGLREKFKAGVERSYRYLPLIESTLAVEGVPDRLKYLPHVESSFYPFAYSKVGAAGMWQFMKSSARLFQVKVGYQIDERRDPYISSRAAAKMLAYNYRRLKKWPLAIMAYNHGPGGVAKAVRGTGTDDIGTIIKSYYSNSFGFASKNFYAEFIAASSIALHADSLYPDLKKMEPLQFQTLVLSKASGIKEVCALTGLTPDEIEEYNLSLRPASFRGAAKLPKGFALRLPINVDRTLLAAKLGSGSHLMPEAIAPTSKPTVAMETPKKVETPSPQKDKVENITVLPPKKAKSKNPVAKIGESNIASIRAPESEVSEKLPTEALPTLPNSVPTVKEKMPVEHILDSTLALQASDLDKLAHPMDRFNASIYNLTYSFANGTLIIQVGTDETLSHYAEWAAVPEVVLRRLNAIRSSKDIRLGRRIKIPLKEDRAMEFVKRREEYYRAIEEDFYSNYYVSLLESIKIEKGMNVWNWALEKEIPFWLLQKHNPNSLLNNMHPGDILRVPTIETGIRKWGFTRYSNSQEYLAGMARFLRSGKPEAF